MNTLGLFLAAAVIAAIIAGASSFVLGLDVGFGLGICVGLHTRYRVRAQRSP